MKRTKKLPTISLAHGLALLAAGVLPALAAADEEPARHEYQRGAWIRFEGEITPQLEQYLYRKLDSARGIGADLVVIEIDSPGGYLQESQRIAEHLRDNVSWAHTVAYIPRQALSGAAMVALGCDEIVMNETALLGDAGPIFQDENYLFRHADEKVVSHLAAWVRTLAEDAGRPYALAEAMVDKDQEVFEVHSKTADETRYITEDELGQYQDRDEWTAPVLVIESQKGRFLEVNGKRAAALGLADDTLKSGLDGMPAHREALRQRFGLADSFHVYEDGWVETVVTVLNWWPVSVLLIIIGLVALYIEFSAPGISIGGLLAGLAFALFFWSRFLGGTSGWLEVLLFVAGVVFVLVEIFLIPGTGVAGISGLLLMVVSIVMAGQNFFVPDNDRQLSTLLHSLLVVAGGGVGFVVVAAVLARHLGSLPMFGRLVLKPPADRKPGVESKDAKGSSDGDDGNVRIPVKIGDWGVAETPLRPAGKVLIGDDYVDVTADGTYIERGTRVRVIKCSGNHVVVREADPVQ